MILMYVLWGTFGDLWGLFYLWVVWNVSPGREFHSIISKVVFAVAVHSDFRDKPITIQTLQ